MKKLSIVLLCICFLYCGCEKVESGNYKQGVYFGSAMDTFGGKQAVATAVVTVSKDGTIESVFLDTTYEKDGVLTTKKTLKENYAMKNASPIGKEWYEQVEALEREIVKKQGLDFITWNEDKTKTDSVTGVTIAIDALYKAVDQAIKQAQ